MNGRTRTIILFALLALATPTLLGVSSAQAEDSFYFESDTGMKFLGANMDDLEGECWFGATGNLIEDNAAENGSIRSENDSPFDECSAAWGANMTYYVKGKGIGAFGFGAFDPLVGSSTVSCQANGVEWERGNGYTPIERFMSAEAEGRTCTVEWLPGVEAAPGARLLPTARWHSRMVDSLARASKGRAKIEVQVFGQGKRAVRERVTLRNRSGRLIGRGTGVARVGSRSTAIAVSLAPFARERLADERELVAKAVLEHVDGTPGTGDRTRQLVVRSTAR